MDFYNFLIRSSRLYAKSTWSAFTLASALATTLQAQELDPSKTMDGQMVISSKQTRSKFSCATHFTRPINELGLFSNVSRLLESELLFDRRIFTAECMGEIFGTPVARIRGPGDSLPRFRGDALTENVAEASSQNTPHYSDEFFAISQTQDHDGVEGVLRLNFSDERKLKSSVVRTLIGGDWKLDESPYSPHATFIPTPTSAEGNRQYYLNKTTNTSISKMWVAMYPSGNVRTFYVEQTGR